MNNKGQTLVLFMLILPLIILVVILVINYGILSNQKLKLKNNIEQAINYGLNLKLEHKDYEDGYLTNSDIENKIKYLLEQNIHFDELDIIVNDTSIDIKLTVANNGLFKILTHLNSKIELHYYGYINNNEIKIERRL